jgi:signal transduction histidine kinase
VAPRLRNRWIEDEVGQQVERGVSAQRQAVGGDHVRSLEDLSASIAHEIRNPITAAKSLVQQMGEDPLSSDNIDYANVALEELDRVERSISHLLKYARDEDLRFEPVRMSEIVESALDTFSDRLAHTSIDLEWSADAAGLVRGDAEKLRRIIINLVRNALDALDESDIHHARVQLGCGENLAGTDVWVRVWDNGPGIEEDTLNNIFDPFYTTKNTGTGLGLALSKKIVDAHGGTLEVESRPGEGSEFVLTLPKYNGNTGDASAGR